MIPMERVGAQERRMLRLLRELSEQDRATLLVAEVVLFLILATQFHFLRGRARRRADIACTLDAPADSRRPTRPFVTATVPARCAG